MSLLLEAIRYDVPDPAAAARFWGALLGRPVAGAVVPRDGAELGLRFVAADPVPGRQERLHLHLTSASPADQRQRVATALDLGARPLDVGQGPDEDHVVLADPAGDPFCVIEPGNRFLAGCGLLAEVTCEGTRAVGVFWHEALGWPLVWDRDGETAVQSPEGGTKVSWGGPPVPPKLHRNGQRLDLTSTDLAADVVRLLSLGATEVDSSPGAVELADPDGNEFHVRAAD